MSVCVCTYTNILFYFNILIHTSYRRRFNISIIDAQMRKLHSHADNHFDLYLDDNIIEMCINLDIEKHACKNVSLIHCFFTMNLRAYFSGIRPDMTEYDFEKYMHNENGPRYSEVTIVPHNVGNFHWTIFILIINKATNEVHVIYIDPLRNKSIGLDEGICKLMKDYLQNYRNLKVLLVEFDDMPMQKNSHDCGVFCIEHATRTIMQAVSNVGNMSNQRIISKLISEMKRWVIQSRVTSRRQNILAEFKQ